MAADVARRLREIRVRDDAQATGERADLVGRVQFDLDVVRLGHDGRPAAA